LGISVEKIKVLGAKLHQHWQRFRQRFKSKTRDTSEHALAYLRGQMTMESGRTFAGIASNMEAADGQSIQHFMSNSPWSGQGVFEQIRDEIKEKAACWKTALPPVRFGFGMKSNPRLSRIRTSSKISRLGTSYGPDRLRSLVHCYYQARLG